VQEAFSHHLRTVSAVLLNCEKDLPHYPIRSGWRRKLSFLTYYLNVGKSDGVNVEKKAFSV